MTISLNLRLPYGWAKSRSMKWFSSHAHGPMGKHKGWEWQSGYSGWTDIFSLELDLIPTGSDHAGAGFSLTILGFMVSASIHDSRHWDCDNGTWEKYDEESINFRISKQEEFRQLELANARRLLNFDEHSQNKKNVEEWLETPQGRQFLDSKVKQKVDEKLLERKNSKEAKAARGAEYRYRNQSFSEK